MKPIMICEGCLEAIYFPENKGDGKFCNNCFREKRWNEVYRCSSCKKVLSEKEDAKTQWGQCDKCFAKEDK